VVDAMQGQDAVNVARAFNEALPLTGVVLTKLDGDARGGAALSVRHVTGKPIKFVGVGEKLDGPRAVPSRAHGLRILGMGDILSLVEEARRTVDLEEAKARRREGQEGQGLRPGGLQAADDADEEDGRHLLDARQAAGAAQVGTSMRRS
jgi:signal recognition particle subunit SRP54